MTSTESLTEFFGWCSLINIGILMVTSLLILLMRSSISKIHGKMFGLGTTEVLNAYFRYLANYKIGIILLNLVPYLALKIMSS